MEFTDPIYHDEDAARRHLEAIRWPDGPYCPYCGSVAVKELGGTSMGPGWYHCTEKECMQKFTVRVGTIFERSHIPLHKWLLGFRLMASSKKGVSAHQLHRTLGITYKSAWFLGHRIRECMKEQEPHSPLGGDGKVVEADETFFGDGGHVFHNERGWQQKRGVGDKHKVMTLVERGGRARSVKVEDLEISTVESVLAGADPQSTLHTDQAQFYKKAGKRFAKHESVNHGKKEYARGDVTTNTVEGFFSIFKRGMVGVYQHCGEQHLKRYLAEFDFRYSNRIKLGVDDAERTLRAIKGAKGRRLQYKKSLVAAA
jgi:transposase-like protein